MNALMLTKIDFIHVNFSDGQTQPSRSFNKSFCHRHTCKTIENTTGVETRNNYESLYSPSKHG